MTDKGTIKIDRDDFERHNDRRKNLGLTWGEYIDGAAPQHGVPDADEVAAAVTASLDLDTDHDFDALAREVASNIDYAELANKVADELEGRMR